MTSETEKLIEDTISLIPEHTWPIVIDELSKRIVNVMPSDVIEELTGDQLDFDKAHETLLSYYLALKDNRKKIIKDAFGFVGAVQILHYLDHLNLDKISAVQSELAT
tara:strand:+ start:6917 stop:7237 length:321 start_codon:yes stop_codon:yes gene_type:complete